MAAVDRFRRRLSGDKSGADAPADSGAPAQGSAVPGDPATGQLVPARSDGEVLRDRAEEDELRARLSEDPNDTQAFDRLAQIVRISAAEGHRSGDPQREADDAVWALAEEIAGNGRAWYPLIELGRLSIDDDREAALRRLGIAAERDPSGDALARGLSMLREAGHPADALNLGVGHWRPREQVVAAGRQLIEAAIEAGRHGEARRSLEALAGHPDQVEVEQLRRELEKRMAQADRDTGTIPRIMTGPINTELIKTGPAAPGGAAQTVDVRDGQDADRNPGLLGFLRR
jgi:hypothetical protein